MRLICYIVLIASVCSGGCRRSPDAQDVDWQQILSGLGAMGINGNFPGNFPILETRELGLLGIPLVLQHELKVEATGQLYSSWAVLGLQSYLVPQGREHIRWVGPTGQMASFRIDQLDRSFRRNEAGDCWIKQSAPAGHAISDSMGRVWQYREGILQSVTHPILGRYEFHCIGSQIHRIRAVDTKHELFVARFGEAGHLESLTVSGFPAIDFHRDESGLLLSITQEGSTLFRFLYDQRVLKKIVRRDGQLMTLGWKENAGWRRSNSLYVDPLCLVSDGANCYDFQINHRGFRYSRTADDDRERIITQFNPRTGVAIQTIWRDGVARTFRASGTPRR